MIGFLVDTCPLLRFSTSTLFLKNPGLYGFRRHDDEYSRLPFVDFKRAIYQVPVPAITSYKL
jgi:hypothetical protein